VVDPLLPFMVVQPELLSPEEIDVYVRAYQQPEEPFAVLRWTIVRPLRT